MRLLLGLLVAVFVVACGGIKLPPVSPDQVEVVYDYQDLEPHKRMAYIDVTYTSSECYSARKSLCDDNDVIDYAFEQLKDWAAKQGADALLIHEQGYSASQSPRFAASAIYFIDRHPELLEQEKK